MLADIIIPAVTASLAIWVMWGYDLTEERANQIKDKRVSRRGELLREPFTKGKK